MRKLLYILLFAGSISFVNAQNGVKSVLLEIEQNNTTLKALQEQSKADKIGNRTENNLSNPEVEFGRSWSQSGGNAPETDINLKQSFDFPTAYRYRSQLAKGKDVRVDLNYRQEYINIIQEARLLCVELIYKEKVNTQLKERFEQARVLSDAYQKLFAKGEISVLERNKTKLNLLNAEKALQVNEVDVSTIRLELQRLNGGLSVQSVGDIYPIYAFPSNFEDWFSLVKSNNPQIVQAEQEIVLSRKQEQLTRAMNLPKITAGYVNKREGGIITQGFTMGVSIPLWEGRNTVKYQRAQTLALESQRDDSQLQFRNALHSQYQKAHRLSSLLNEYNEALNVTNDYSLLKMAFDKGQLSLINYLLELEVYYDTLDKFLETERDYQLALSELVRWEM